MARSKKHTHKYYQEMVNWHHKPIWKCALPDCMHYWPPHLGDVNGKNSICWECGEIFMLHPLNMNMKQPICDSCRLDSPTEESPLSDKIKEFLANKPSLKTGTEH